VVTAVEQVKVLNALGARTVCMNHISRVT